MKIHKYLKFLILLPLLCFSQEKQQIHYSIVKMEFNPSYNVIKVKVPSWLETNQLKEQLKKVLIWPGDPPPDKQTYIYVFKETESVDSESDINCVYTPGKGFKWNLMKWEPQSFEDMRPTAEEIKIYSTLVDSIISKGSSLSNITIREHVAKEYNIEVTQLDSIYAKVKYWYQNYHKE